MDPWDINISTLAKKYIQTLKKLKEMNLRLSGKVLLAAALLLRIKSSRLVGEDMMEFDRLLASGGSDELYGEEQFLEGELEGKGLMYKGMGDWRLIPRTPQPRKRKVSVYDLIDALAVALNVRRRRILSQIQTREFTYNPGEKVDISKLMDELYIDVMQFLSVNSAEKVAFSDIVRGGGKREKVLTFIPLLHLTTERKTDLEQHNHFGEIWVRKAVAGFHDSDEGIPVEVKRQRKKADPNAPKKPRALKKAVKEVEIPKSTDVPTSSAVEDVPEDQWEQYDNPPAA
jgi:segregation and condensation protein A